ncbi:hypothetical protein OG401_21005 [Kitasatospora purpeofusca]|nr:hypothetical protein [Kitasatospora purpeofusca]MCX4686760.1 hypothetical protein [Kitasatospora purpeofusca]
MAYERLTGPLGPERGDVLHGILTAVTHNTAARKKRAPKDFIPKWTRGPRRAQPWQDMLAVVRAANTALGGTDRTPRREG